MKNKLNNILLIETFNSLGTGIIFPCRYDSMIETKEDTDYNYYVILTNYHVIHNRENIEEPVEKILIKYIKLVIFDKNMKLISDDDYEIIEIEEKFSLFEEEDIVAMLVKIRKVYEIAECCEIGDFEELEEGDVLYTKGFPGLLQENVEALPIRFAGNLQLNCYKNGKMGTYRILENFHFYSDYRDEDMFSGLSGGPVFVEQDGNIRLIGMNQGVFADNYGDSPYQLLRFLEIKHILEYLRKNKCILYSLLYGTISIIWTKNRNEIQKNENKEREKEAICVLGGSGAGKSSFVESLTQHAHILETVGDGQTTRTDLYYYLSLYNDNPTAKVVFLDKKSFAQKMYQAVFSDLLALIFEYEFGFRKIDIRVEPYRFLRSNLDYLQIVLDKYDKYKEENKKYLSIKNLCIQARDNEHTEVIYKCYIQFCYMMHQCMNCYGIKPQVLKNIFDINTREKIMTTLISLSQEKVNNTDIHEINGIDLEEFYNQVTNDNQLSKTELVKNLEILPLEAKKLFVNAVLKTNESSKETEDDKNIRENAAEDNRANQYMNALCIVLEEQNGIFSYDEVRYLLEEETEHNKNNNTGNNQKLFGVSKADSLINDVRDTFFSKEDVKSNKIEKLYEELYEKIMEKLENDKKFLEKGVSLVDMSLREKRLINLCVRISYKKSLSAFVDHIEIRDCYYYEYAIPIYESRRNETLLIDTCGLDHIDKGKRNYDTLLERVTNIKSKLDRTNKDSNNKYNLNNIIYLKKLDAGKPTEISDIFAYIADMNIKGGLYCVFTGLDIYENTNNYFFAKNKNWHIDHAFDQYPKVMQYLMDNQNKEELLRMCNCISYKKENLYRVMSQNVITYCANKRLIEKRGKYQENNIIGIRTLFESIFQKEIDLFQLFMNQDEEIKKFEKLTEKEAIKNELKKLIFIMFDLASVTKWERYYWQTLNANLKSYENSRKGFARTYNHTWHYLFMDGYQRTFEKEYSEDFYKLFEEYEERAYLLVKQLGDKYVMDMIDLHLEAIYEEALKNSNGDIINAYDANQVIEEKKNMTNTTNSYAKLLQKITNFGLLLRTCSEQKGIDHLVDLFLNMLKSENKECANGKNDFFETRVDIRNKTDELIKAIKSYGFGEDTVKALICGRIDENKDC